MSQPDIDPAQLVDLTSLFVEPASIVTSFLYHHFDEQATLDRLKKQLGEPGLTVLPIGTGRLLEAVRYSLFQSEAKRFRPVLGMLTARALEQPWESVVPVCAAIECIHTYSLIHDDLPAMDDDNERRGQPTNHIKFDEATAILAGDSLLTEAFGIVADAYSAKPEIISELMLVLTRASGMSGMVGGQAVDMAFQGLLPDTNATYLKDLKDSNLQFEALRRMHRLKTGALIRSVVHASALVCEAPPAKLRDLVVYADLLGLAFQVADDILDFQPESPEPGSFPSLLGLEATRTLLSNLTDACLGALRVWPSDAESLRQIAQYNFQRLK